MLRQQPDIVAEVVKQHSRVAFALLGYGPHLLAHGFEEHGRVLLGVLDSRADLLAEFRGDRTQFLTT